jgi:hypothetical protein
VQSKWQQHQRKVLINNRKITGGFIFALIGIGVIYFLFKDHYHWPFHASIAIIYLLLIVFLIVTWKSYAFKKDNFETTSLNFINYQLSKLKWQRKTLTTYVWIYNVLLWLALCLYTVEVTQNGSFLFVATALFCYNCIRVRLVYLDQALQAKKTIAGDRRDECLPDRPTQPDHKCIIYLIWIKW